jgi:anti-sigma factor (TIGR02949 family)
MGYSEEEACGHDCDEALAHLWEFLDAELGAAEAERIRAHLQTCTGCHTEHDVELVLKQVVRRGCAERAPAALRLRIHEQITVLRATGRG